MDRFPGLARFLNDGFLIFFLLLFRNMNEEFQQAIMSVCQHLFKRVDLIKSNPGGFCFILYFNIIFQVVPAVTVNKDIPRRRKSFPKRGKERLLPLLLRNSCGSENPESAGIHILHHLPDDFAAAGMTPAFKDHDHRHACISCRTLCFTQFIAQFLVQQLFQV